MFGWRRPRLVLYLGAALAPHSHRKRRAGFFLSFLHPEICISLPQRVKADSPTSRVALASFGGRTGASELGEAGRR